ncbi:MULTISPECIES: hypothetical protein [Bacteroidota]|jgi:hypothetical protein|uniref:Dabb family protein n=1 Tax=Sphingobacterium humi TaxID=1796905 RepID=A0A6N8L0D7_9SPHI|nr:MULTISPECIES: hypothetical protein [Bacteroidota]MDV3793742.1 hypothetical protein [Elizabethkingia anophelis]MDV3830910.1 hypothetical protein [Elizabethkingia anophelis]MVZ62469.1 hypothetical protein [Sphingobacterium humi]
MEKVILVFVKLKKDIDRSAFEAFEEKVAKYNITLSSHKSFKVLRTIGVLGNETLESPYDYIEIIDIVSLESMYQTVEKDGKIKAFIEEFQQFAEKSQFLITEYLVSVASLP